MSGDRAKILGRFSGRHSALVGGMLARAPASPAYGLHSNESRYFNLPHFSVTCGLEKLGLGLLIKLVGA